MLKLTVLLGMLIVLVITGSAHALVSYTFSGPGGLDGTLLLDDIAPFVITPGPPFFPSTSATLDSPLNFISGRFGDFTFFGRPQLQIFKDERPDPSLPFNTWFVVSDVVGPPVGAVVPVRIRLGFSDIQFVSISLIPPQNVPGDVADSAFFAMALSSDDIGQFSQFSQPVTISGRSTSPNRRLPSCSSSACRRF